MNPFSGVRERVHWERIGQQGKQLHVTVWKPRLNRNSLHFRQNDDVCLIVLK